MTGWAQPTWARPNIKLPMNRALRDQVLNISVVMWIPVKRMTGQRPAYTFSA